MCGHGNVICTYVSCQCYFCMLVISVLRMLTISGFLHLQYRWLSESGCWLQMSDDEGLLGRYGVLIV